jgi:hypothetical protein
MWINTGQPPYGGTVTSIPDNAFGIERRQPTRRRSVDLRWAAIVTGTGVSA